MDLKEMT